MWPETRNKLTIKQSLTHDPAQKSEIDKMILATKLCNQIEV
jgi:hypothetical protein